MKLVADTNVLVSGFLQPRGPSGQIVRAIAQGAIRLFFDARILEEYREVLLRPKFTFRPADVASFLDQVRSLGTPVAASPLSIQLLDPDDTPFLEVALSARATYLVTGNRRHFPESPLEILKIVTPREFLEQGYPSHPSAATSRSASLP